MRAYRAHKRAAGLKLASEWVPSENALAVYSDHRIREARSLALHCLIARKFEREPALLDIAHRNLERWSERYAERERRYVREWREILCAPWPAVAELMTSVSDKAVATGIVRASTAVSSSLRVSRVSITL